MEQGFASDTFMQAMGFEKAKPASVGFLRVEMYEMYRAIDASRQELQQEQDARRVADAFRQWQEFRNVQIAEKRSLEVWHEHQAMQRVKDTGLARVQEVEARSIPDIPMPLAGMMASLRQNHPSIVKEIKYMAGATLKFDYLRACLLEDEDFEGKQRRFEIYEQLSPEDRQDLERSFHLSDGQRDAFILEVVTEDRRMRAKLSSTNDLTTSGQHHPSAVFPALVRDADVCRTSSRKRSSKVRSGCFSSLFSRAI
jgi:hypothetical protein